MYFNRRDIANGNITFNCWDARRSKGIHNYEQFSKTLKIKDRMAINYKICKLKKTFFIKNKMRLMFLYFYIGTFILITNVRKIQCNKTLRIYTIYQVYRLSLKNSTSLSCSFF
jgi:hypothetical protein